jgi:hypothetical protein
MIAATTGRNRETATAFRLLREAESSDSTATSVGYH